MSRIVSLDLSLTASAWALGVDGKLQGSGLLPGKYDSIARLVHVRNKVCGKVDELKPDIVVMEDLSFGSKGQAVHDHAGLARMVQAEFFTDGMPWVLVAPSSLKKFCCGTAGSPKNPMKKEHILKFLATRFGHDVNDNNIADAIVLSYIGMSLMGEWSPTIQAQEDVLKKIRETNPSLRSLRVVAPVEAVKELAEW